MLRRALCSSVIILLAAVVIAAGLSLCAYAETAYSVAISSSDGSDTEARLGQTVTAHVVCDIDYKIVWYCGGEEIEEGDSIEVTAAMLGEVLNAKLLAGDAEYVSNDITIAPQAPTLSMTAEGGDYLITVNWTSEPNGSPVTGYELSLYYSYDVETPLITVNLTSDIQTYTFDNLTGGIEYTVRLVAANGAGTVSAIDTAVPDDPNLQAVNSARAEIEGGKITIHMSLANDKSSVQSYLQNYFSGYSGYGVTLSEIIVTSVVPAAAKTAEDSVGSVGSFVYIIEIGKGDARATTKAIFGTIDNTTSIVYITSSADTITLGEKAELTANAVDIPSAQYKWYVSADNRGDGKEVAGQNESVYSFTPESEGVYYIYCVCGIITSDMYKITVKTPFVPVSEITCSVSTVFEGESKVINAVVYPHEATERTVVWTVEDDGGCGVYINGRVIKAQNPGEFSLRATVAGGLADGDFYRVFTFICEGEEESETSVEETQTGEISVQVDVSSLSGVQSATAVLLDGGEVQFTALSETTTSALFKDAGITDTNVRVITGIRFVYLDGALTSSVTLTLDAKYAGRTIYVIIRNETGNVTTVEKKATSRGEITLNAYTPDAAVIYMTEDSESPTEWLWLLIIPVPAIAAGFITYYLIKKGKKNE